MSLLIKICGLRDEATVMAAVEAGADAVGFVFHAASPRNIEPAAAARLAGLLPPGVLSVAVTLQPTAATVAAVLRDFRPDVWQSDALDFVGMELPASVAHWPVLRSLVNEALPARLLFEAAQSGSGTRADWRAAAVMAARSELILGGGLNVGNIAAAIQTVRPYGVDVSSGVESAPGVKDAGLIQGFVAAARRAAAGVAND